MVMSGRSLTTALAAAFMRSSALLSFGFSKPYFAQSPQGVSVHDGRRPGWASTYLVKPLPSIRTTIQVLGSRISGCSNCFTYSYLVRTVGQSSFQVAATPGMAHFELAM